MHELSVCRRMIQRAEDIAKEHSASAISRIELQIGPLSGVEPDLLAHAFHIARQSTLAREAELIIEKTAVRLCCRDCDHRFSGDVHYLRCDACGSSRVVLNSGDEMLLTGLRLVNALN